MEKNVNHIQTLEYTNNRHASIGVHPVLKSKPILKPEHWKAGKRPGDEASVKKVPISYQCLRHILNNCTNNYYEHYLEMWHT